MAFKPSLTIANFTCLFGEKKVLLDLFHEVIYPAFFESPPRSYARNVFHLFELEFKHIGDSRLPEPYIAGRFVRDTDLTRSHVLRDDQLIPDSSRMESATGARFVLLLSSHTLLYVPETPHAPPLAMFRSTMQFHLKKAWASYIKAEVKRLKRANLKGPKARELYIALVEQIPPPDLTLLELPSSISIDQFLARFKQIDRVEYRINDTNHSLDFMPLVNELRSHKQSTDSTEIIVVESKPKNREALSQQINEATRAGHVDAKVSGRSLEGGKIIGTNEEFRISIPLGILPAQLGKFVRVAYNKFKRLSENGEIQVSRTQGGNVKKLEEIARQCESLDDR